MTQALIVSYGLTYRRSHYDTMDPRARDADDIVDHAWDAVSAQHTAESLGSVSELKC